MLTTSFGYFFLRYFLACVVCQTIATAVRVIRIFSVVLKVHREHIIEGRSLKSALDYVMQVNTRGYDERESTISPFTAFLICLLVPPFNFSYWGSLLLKAVIY